jgi:hypothetical protein
MRHSNTGKESIDKIQTMYNRTYRLKGRILRTMPNEVMWSSKERCGMDWVNLWDEISIDRTVAWMKHANSGGVVGDRGISCQEIRRNCALVNGSTGISGQGNVGRHHDGTNRGVEDWHHWERPQHNRGSDQLREAKKRHCYRRHKQRTEMESNGFCCGCRITGWISEMFTTDDNTWISKLQRNGKFNNNDTFVRQENG